MVVGALSARERREGTGRDNDDIRPTWRRAGVA